MEAIKLRIQEEEKRAGKTDDKPLDISVVIPVCENSGDVREIYRQYSKELKDGGYSCEFIFVIDGSDPHALESQKRLKDLDPAVRVICFKQSFCGAAAPGRRVEK
jgi:hypothetical protein